MPGSVSSSRNSQSKTSSSLYPPSLRTVIRPGRCLRTAPSCRKSAGLLTVLYDGRFTDEEAFEWLFRADDSLPGTPIEALRGDRHTEVTRRAQALAF